MDALFDSIQFLNFKKHADMAGIALRCYVDMLVYQFLYKKKLLGELYKDDLANLTAHNEKNMQHSNNTFKQLMQLVTMKSMTKN